MRRIVLLFLFLFSLNLIAKPTNLICSEGFLSFVHWDGTTDGYNQIDLITISFDEETQGVTWQGRDLTLWLCKNIKSQSVEIKENEITYECTSSPFNESSIIESANANWNLNRYTGVLSWNRFQTHKNGRDVYVVDGKSSCKLNKKKF